MPAASAAKRKTEPHAPRPLLPPAPTLPPVREAKRPRETKPVRKAPPKPAWSFRLDRDTTRVPAPSAPLTFGARLKLYARNSAFGFAAALIAWSVGWCAAFVIDQREISRGRVAINAVVERIVQVESSGNANAKNPRSTATGAAQFIETTWLDLVRQHRADLMAKPQSEILDLRRDPKLSRELTARFIERNAKVLRRSGHPITPGTLYLSHFAGGAGAVAILSAQEQADAALTLANADSTGKMSREKLVKANPFLAGVTAGGLKRWADKKMLMKKPHKIGARATAKATRSL